MWLVDMFLGMILTFLVCQVISLWFTGPSKIFAGNTQNFATPRDFLLEIPKISRPPEIFAGNTQNPWVFPQFFLSVLEILGIIKIFFRLVGILLDFSLSTEKNVHSTFSRRARSPMRHSSLRASAHLSNVVSLIIYREKS